jgi:hypothetical protein
MTEQETLFDNRQYKAIIAKNLYNGSVSYKIYCYDSGAVIRCEKSAFETYVENLKIYGNLFPT